MQNKNRQKYSTYFSVLKESPFETDILDNKSTSLHYLNYANESSEPPLFLRRGGRTFPKKEVDLSQRLVTLVGKAAQHQPYSTSIKV